MKIRFEIKSTKLFLFLYFLIIIYLFDLLLFNKNHIQRANQLNFFVPMSIFWLKSWLILVKVLSFSSRCRMQCFWMVFAFMRESTSWFHLISQCECCCSTKRSFSLHDFENQNILVIELRFFFCFWKMKFKI